MTATVLPPELLAVRSRSAHAPLGLRQHHPPPPPPPLASQLLRPESVAPVVAYLCSEACSTTGAIVECGGYWAGRLRWQRSGGAYVHPDTITLEGVRETWGPLVDFAHDRATIPTSNQDAFTHIMERASGGGGGGSGGGGAGGSVMVGPITAKL
jgi:uncharacterized membrane protein YgcG